MDGAALHMSTCQVYRYPRLWTGNSCYSLISRLIIGLEFDVGRICSECTDLLKLP